jgi:hypothetical protein
MASEPANGTVPNTFSVESPSRKSSMPMGRSIGTRSDRLNCNFPNPPAIRAAADIPP